MFLLYLSQSPKCKYPHRCVMLQLIFLFNLHPTSEFPLPPFPNYLKIVWQELLMTRKGSKGLHLYSAFSIHRANHL